MAVAKELGRNITVKRGSASPQEAIANVRTKSLSVNRETIDESDADSGRWMERFDGVGQVDVSISVEGVMKAETLRTEAFSTDGLKSTTFEYNSGATITGSFIMSSYEEEAAYNDVVTFSAEFQGSGIITSTTAP